MRLDATEIAAIRTAARAVFGPTVTVRVFGSRLDDDRKGGDLDLYLEVDPGRATLANELSLRDRLERPLDALKLDVVVHERGRPRSPIAEIALRDGEAL